MSILPLDHDIHSVQSVGQRPNCGRMTDIQTDHDQSTKWILNLNVYRVQPLRRKYELNFFLFIFAILLRLFNCPILNFKCLNTVLILHSPQQKTKFFQFTSIVFRSNNLKFTPQEANLHYARAVTRMLIEAINAFITKCSLCFRSCCVLRRRRWFRRLPPRDIRTLTRIRLTHTIPHWQRENIVLIRTSD